MKGEGGGWWWKDSSLQRCHMKQKDERGWGPGMYRGLGGDSWPFDRGLLHCGEGRYEKGQRKTWWAEWVVQGME